MKRLLLAMLVFALVGLLALGATVAAADSPAAKTMDEPTGLAPVSNFADMSAYGSTEGIVNDREGNLFVGTFNTGKILKITPTGQTSGYATIPGFVGADASGGQQNAMLGLVMDSEENIYAMVGAFPFGSTPNAIVGVWKISPGGETVAMFSAGADAGMSSPNFGILDKSGNMFVSDSFLGVIYKIDKSGHAVQFVNDALLRPDANAIFAVGANGLALDGAGDLYVAVTFPHSQTDPEWALGRIVKVPVNRDGTAGALSVVTEQVIGPDGLLFAGGDTLFVVQNADNSIATVSEKGQVSKIAAGSPLLNMPASLAMKGDTLYVTNLAFFAPPANISAIDLEQGY